MKKSKFTDEQMVAIVQESEGGGVKETALSSGTTSVNDERNLDTPVSTWLGCE